MREDDTLNGRHRGRFGRRELEFFGSLSASVTHELNNVLSIIDQIRGLLGDAVSASRSGRAIDACRIEVAHERLEHQVRRGIDIVARFNRFCHSVDDPVSDLDVGAEVSNIVSLTRRFADLKKVGLEYAGTKAEIRAVGDAFSLQQAIFYCLQGFLEESRQTDRIRVGVRKHEDAALVSIDGSARGVGKPGDVRFSRLADLLDRLGGSLQIGDGEQGGTSVELRLPASPAGEVTDHG